MNNYEFLDFFIKIDKYYPDGLINNLKEYKLLYKEAKDIAKYKKQTLKEFFESNGYRYIYNDIKKIRRDLKKSISYYSNTNNTLDNLHLKDNSLYFKVLRYAKLEDMDIDEYMNFLGFNYNKKQEKENLRVIKKELLKLYPNKKVKKLSMKDSKLYSKIYKLAKKENLTTNSYLEKIGFII